ncbi:MAG: hypothetical protein JNM66_12365 [Bryobacterales bacterium]|nr:hypothetical protein [Bryobacterales bacterium]
MRWILVFTCLGMQAAPAGAEKFIQQFDKLRPKRAVRVEAAPEPRACSVGLKEMAVKDAEKFTAQRVPVKETVPMPKATLPAPPCESR